MAQYLIYFNQQWVGDHSEEWFASRGPLARAVVEEMRADGVLVFAGGLVEEIDETFHVDPTSEPLRVGRGPYKSGSDFIGGMTLIEVPDESEAQYWAQKVAQACGWPQEVRVFKP